MALQDFQQQSQNAMQSGLRLGGALQNAQSLQEGRAFDEQMNPLRIEQAQLQGQGLRAQASQQEQMNPLLVQQQQLQNEKMQQQNSKAELTQDAVLLFTIGEEGKDKLIPQMIEKYKDQPMVIAGLEKLYASKNSKEYDATVLGMLSAASGKPIGGKKRALSETEKNFETLSVLESELQQAQQSGDQDLIAGRQAQVDRFKKLSNKYGATAQEKSDIKTGAVTTKSNIQRRQGYIDSGVDAADSYGNLKRSVELLKSVPTGGFDAAALRAKQMFGIESADEAELSAKMGKSVMAQLKPLFGAAFTEGEGNRLVAIEAGFGKSTEGNIRLINETLKITERAMRRGLRAAEDQGDQFVVDEIKAIMASFEEIKPKDEVKPVVKQYSEGMTATGAGGKKMIYKNGQWVDQ